MTDQAKILGNKKIFTTKEECTEPPQFGCRKETYLPSLKKDGITLRELFAGMAMLLYKNYDITSNERAVKAVKQADELLEELVKTDKTE